MRGFLVNTPAQARAVMARVNGPVQCILDTLHLGVEGIDPVAEITHHASCFAHVQLADTPSRQTPGQGHTDFEGFYRALARSDYSGWVGAEYHPQAQAPLDLNWLAAARRILNTERNAHE